MTASTLDFSSFIHGDEVERQKVAQALLERLAQQGHAELTGHGISDETVDRTFGLVSLLVREIASHDYSRAD